MKNLPVTFGKEFTFRLHLNPRLVAAVRPLRRRINLSEIRNCAGRVMAGLVALACFGVGRGSAAAAAPVDLAVLVVAAEETDFSLEPIREALDFLGTPYSVHVATKAPGALTAGALTDGAKGRYSGVILTTGSLSHSTDGGATWQSALSSEEWGALQQYELQFGVRQLNWYTYPSPEYGFNWPNTAMDTLNNPVTGNWTAAGQAGFVYLNTTNSFSISNVWTYLATPWDTNTTPWLQDAQGNALIAVKKFGDGREVMSLTFDSATWLVPNNVLYHGLVNWVNKGLFLGERHTYLSAQIDDVFLADDIYTGGEYRQNAADWKATIVWQNNFRKRASGKNFRYDMAFNGLGTVPGQYVPDDLTPYAKKTQGQFKWISHTFSHPYLDNVSYATALTEVVTNNQIAASLGLKKYSALNMVTPNITGLKNPQFLNAAYDAGIRYLVTDTSIPEHRAPSPNVGIPNWFVPGILMIPRHANNLFYNVSTPAEWEVEYNALYSAWWGRNLTYPEILDDQADLLLRALVKGDVSPQMFHQPNLRAYNATGNTLLGDLLDKVADKYEALYNFPFLSPTMNQLGETVKARMAYNVSGVRASLDGNGKLVITAQQAVTVPVTGLQTRRAELYAGQYITYVKLKAGQTVTISLPEAATTETDTVAISNTESVTEVAESLLGLAL